MTSLTVSQIETLIYYFRGHRVMLDSDLAEIYGVETRVLNQAVSRNIYRFPEDFAFKLNKEEWENLKSQSVTSKNKHGGRRKLPYVFTEQGVAMLSSVLNSKQAIIANVEIMRTFVKLRDMVSTYAELEKRILKLEKKSDDNYKTIVKALLMLQEQIEPFLPKNRRKIGLKSKK